MCLVFRAGLSDFQYFFVQTWHWFAIYLEASPWIRCSFVKNRCLSELLQSSWIKSQNISKVRKTWFGRYPNIKNVETKMPNIILPWVFVSLLFVNFMWQHMLDYKYRKTNWTDRKTNFKKNDGLHDLNNKICRCGF